MKDVEGLNCAYLPRKIIKFEVDSRFQLSELLKEPFSRVLLLPTAKRSVIYPTITATAFRSAYSHREQLTPLPRREIVSARTRKLN